MGEHATFGEITAIPLTEIDATDRLRRVDPAHVEAIALSIEQCGLQAPVILRPDGNRYRLVAGWHRLSAVEKLGWTSIDAIVQNLTEDEARLVEIDENLMRRELSALDRALFLAKRKESFDQLHPETAKPGRRKKELAKTFRQFGETFAKATANRLGLNKRTIEIALALAKSLSPEAREVLRLSDIADNQAELLKLATLEPEKQIAAARMLASGLATRVKGARVALGLDVIVEEVAGNENTENRISEVVLIPIRDVYASAGTGAENGDEPIIGHMQFPDAFARSWGRSLSKVEAVQIKGDSMYPTIADGQWTLIDRGDTDLVEGKVYGFRTEDGFRAKRFQRAIDGAPMLVSDNRELYAPEKLSKAYLQRLLVAGRIFLVPRMI